MALRLREARRGDEMAVAELHVRSWQEAYRELMPAEFLAALDPEERAGRYRFESEEGPTTVLAVNDCGGDGGDDGANEGDDQGDEVGEGGSEGDPSLTKGEVRPGSPSDPLERLLGFVTFGESRDEDAGGLGEVYALYVDPDCLRGGVGRTLMAEARGRLADAGFQEAILWVLQGNERARRFYEGEGWSPDGATREENPYDIVSNVARFRRRLP